MYRRYSKKTTLFSVLVFSLFSAHSNAEVRGGLTVETPEGTSIEMPLTALDVSAQVTGSIAEVTVTQTYSNPFEDRIEAVYVFPLPEDAAVNEMSMVIGDRRIRADLQEREHARRTYEQARDRGQTTSLLEQERPNVFTQSIANIEPGHPIQVLISYVEQLPYQDHQYTFAFPMVVGPRYIPGESVSHNGTGMLSDTTVVVDASRITPPVLPAGITPSYPIDFTLTLDGGMPLRELISPSHDLDVEWHDDRAATVSIPAHQRTPDRDVVLSYSLASEEPQVGVLSHFDERGGFFTLLVEPPSLLREADVRPKELVFVVDMSGSMRGEPLDTCKQAMRLALSNLNPGDTFQIVRFSESASALSPEPLSNTPENVELGLQYVDEMTGSGGTQMIEGVRAALSPPNDPDRMRIVLFMTDGYIGNEYEILGEVGDLLNETRLFSLGVGSSVNRYLLDKLAEVGRGTVQYVDVEEPADQVVEAFYRRIRNPILTDITVDWGGLDVSEVTPGPIPDVFEGTPLLLTGRYERGDAATVTISGRRGVSRTAFSVAVELTEDEAASAIPYIWARRQVDAIERSIQYSADDSVKAAITDLALQYGLLTRYTSFVAVEERIVANAEDPLRTIAVAVALPDGVSEAGIGAHVSPDYVQPGDPELTVCTPEPAIGVTAYFPFGLVQTLTLDGDSGCWMSRFLVPRDVEDGSYEILVAIEDPAGQVTYEEVPLWVDATAPTFTVDALPGTILSFDQVVTFEARIVGPVVSACEDVSEGDDNCAEVLPERIKFVRLYLPDGRVVRMFPSDMEDGLWTFSYRIRERIGDGEHLVIIEAVDVAGNSTMLDIELTVQSSVAANR